MKKNAQTEKIARNVALERGSAIDLRGKTWDVFRIMAEFVEGYQFLTKFERQVTVFGSARTFPNNKFYKDAERLGELLAKGKYTTITGGGPGIMEAANKGAFEAGGKSVGLNIELPHEQRLNPYVRDSLGFHYFLSRKVMLTTPSQAFIYYPGGFGTLDELFEVLDLIHTKRLERVPVLLIDHSFWDPIISFLRENAFEKTHAITGDDLTLIRVVDNANEAYEIIKQTKSRATACSLDASNFCSDDSVNWRVFRIMAELVEGFQFLSDTKNVVTILGTPHIRLESRYYSDAYKLGSMLAKKKFSVMTGGLSGIMEAANKGAFEAGMPSLGIDIQEPHNERINPYVTKSRSFHFPFTRKLMLATPSTGVVLFPCGYGTLTVCFELLTLMQTGKIPRVPLLLYGKEYWTPLIKYIEEKLFKTEHTIESSDTQLYRIVDTSAEAMIALK